MSRHQQSVLPVLRQKMEHHRQHAVESLRAALANADREMAAVWEHATTAVKKAAKEEGAADALRIVHLKMEALLKNPALKVTQEQANALRKLVEDVRNRKGL